MKRKQHAALGGVLEFFENSRIPLKATEDEVVRAIQQNIKDARQEHRLHGLRVEAMFSYVAGALGECKLVKQEDAGGVCLVGQPECITIPDFRLILKSGTQFFVEVKNCHDFEMVLKQSYVEQLVAYTAIHGLPLKIAIYWSKFRVWTMIPVDSLIFDSQQKCLLKLTTTMPINEMAMLGDVSIGTKSPLSMKLLSNPEEAEKIASNGQAMFKIGKVEFYCDKTLIEDEFEKNLAFHLMLSGRWPCGEGEALITHGRLYGVEYRTAPEQETPNQGFEIIGSLSEIISDRYNHATAPKGDIERLMPASEPEQFNVFIPKDYKGKHLPIWRFVLQPNPNALMLAGK